ncbi:MAG TPA: LptF/LptG family permease [bacterium]|nr:LptF/LptG family permease [bacterium]
MPRIYRYLLAEMVLPFGMALSVISFLLLTRQLLNLVDLVLKNGVPLGVVFRLVAYIVPATFAITVPMSLLVAVLMALGRLASDMELVALRAGGVSLSRLYAPMIAVGLVFSLGMLVFNETALPRFNEAYKVLFYEVLNQRSDVALQEKIWIKDFEGILVYVDSKDPESKDLRGVTIIRLEQPGQALQWIRARRGKLHSDPSGYRVFLDLYDGTLQILGGDRGENLTTLAYQYSRFDLDLGGALSQIRDSDRDPSEMTIREIDRSASAMAPADPRRAHWLTEMYKKIAIPFACLFFLLCGFPLGTLTRRGGRMMGFVFAISLIFTYYLLLSLGQTYGDDARMPAWLAMWIPNFVMGLVALWAGWSAFKERGFFAFGRG